MIVCGHLAWLPECGIIPPVATSKPEPGTAAYLTLLPAWSPDGPGAALDRPCEGWNIVGRWNHLGKSSSVMPSSGPRNMPKVHTSREWTRPGGPAFTVFGEPAPEAALLGGMSIADALAIVDAGQTHARPWDWYFVRQEGPWLADLRTQLHLTTGELAERTDAPEGAIAIFEESPELQSLDLFQLTRIVHVLAGLPIPSDEEIEGARDRALHDSKPMGAAIHLLLALHPDATLPASPPFGTTPPRKDLMKVVLDEITPVLRSKGFKRRGMSFTAEPEPHVSQYLAFLMGKGSLRVRGSERDLAHDSFPTTSS